MVGVFVAAGISRHISVYRRCLSASPRQPSTESTERGNRDSIVGRGRRCLPRRLEAGWGANRCPIALLTGVDHVAGVGRDRQRASCGNQGLIGLLGGILSGRSNGTAKVCRRSQGPTSDAATCGPILDDLLCSQLRCWTLERTEWWGALQRSPASGLEVRSGWSAG